MVGKVNIVGEIKKFTVKEDLKFFSGFGVGEFICCLDNQGRVWRRPVAADNDFGKWMLIENPQIEQLQKSQSQEEEALIQSYKVDIALKMEQLVEREQLIRKLNEENHDLKEKVAQLQKKCADAFMKEY